MGCLVIVEEKALSPYLFHHFVPSSIPIFLLFPSLERGESFLSPWQYSIIISLHSLLAFLFLNRRNNVTINTDLFRTI